MLGEFWRRDCLGELEIYLTHTAILEAYNVLFWFYQVRPLKRLVEKIKLTTDELKVVET